jgi:hypothetical protein
MTLTLRQIMAYLEFSDGLDRTDHANALRIAWTGAQCDKQAVDKVLKELSD